MIDRTTKILLIVIALGLWANAMMPLFRPHPVAAQANTLSSIDDHLDNIETTMKQIRSDVDSIERISRGVCPNDKIC